MMKKSKMVEIELDIPPDILWKLFMRAHEQDINLNKLVCKILQDHIKKEKKKPAGK